MNNNSEEENLDYFVKYYNTTDKEEEEEQENKEEEQENKKEEQQKKEFDFDFDLLGDLELLEVDPEDKDENNKDIDNNKHANIIDNSDNTNIDSNVNSIDTHKDKPNTPIINEDKNEYVKQETKNVKLNKIIEAINSVRSSDLNYKKPSDKPVKSYIKSIPKNIKDKLMQSMIEESNDSFDEFLNFANIFKDELENKEERKKKQEDRNIKLQEEMLHTIEYKGKVFTNCIPIRISVPIIVEDTYYKN